MIAPALAQQIVDIALLLLLGAWASLLLLLEWRRHPHRPPLRASPLYARLRVIIDRATETGQAIHLAMGSRALLNAAPEAAAAVAIVRAASSERGPDGAPNIASCGDPALYTLTAGPLAGLDARVVLAGTAPEGGASGAYAAGVWAALEKQRLAGEVLMGPLGVEGLLLAEGRRPAAPERLCGAAHIDDAGVLLLGGSAWAVGEDYYAASAHTLDPSHAGGLAVQDALRVLLALAMLAGAVARLLGWWA